MAFFLFLAFSCFAEMAKIKVKFLSNLKFDEYYVTCRLAEVCPHVNIRDVHNTNLFSIIVLDNQADANLLLDPALVAKLEEAHLRPVPSQAYSISKAVFVTKLRPYILEYSQDVILNNINQGNEQEASAVIVLQNRHLWHSLYTKSHLQRSKRR